MNVKVNKYYAVAIINKRASHKVSDIHTGENTTRLVVEVVCSSKFEVS